MTTVLRDPPEIGPDSAGQPRVSCDRLRRNQLARLLRIVVALRAERCPNTRELAEACEVSRRTIFRDLETIEAAGIPIVYDPTRQGYRLEGPGRLEATTIEVGEAETLLTLLTRWGGSDSKGLVGLARAGIVELVRSVPRPAIDALPVVAVRDLPRAGSVGSGRRRPIFDQILQAVTLRRVLDLVVGEPIADRVVATRFRPYRIVLDPQGWATVGHSSDDGLVCLIPFGAIVQALVSEEEFEVPARFALEQRLERISRLESARRDRPIRLRVAAELVGPFRAGVFASSVRIEPTADDRVDLVVSVDDPEELVDWIFQQRGLVEVIEPPDLRRRVRVAAVRVARGHRAQATSTPREARGHFGRVSG